MSIESRTVDHQENPEKPTLKASRGFLQNPETSSQGDDASPEKTQDKMGFIFSKIAKQIGSKPCVAYDSAGTKVSMNSGDDLITPETPELDDAPTRPGSTSRLKHITSNDFEHQSSLLWPYVKSHAHHNDLESENPLRLRRPALYEEYWACEPRPTSS
ncbi:hypothetical protein INS49_002644 [Diaporthe citri]|uniref:uncharacterized protein n=1 Tax=Diaporthe citri TaxID=83186 RepID=UPI001C7FEBFA|nr:uncharacterized protein INS49_002644 [Diaporthe citri]KAG6368437.1 hypothetical protein INS49_002644 [Diaporthe citri]